MATIDKFINPYHFLPLDSEVPRKNVFKKKEEQKENREQLYTGEIQVELKIRTPLFIPDCHGAENKEGEHKTFEFFTYDGENPVIPGSSIRGMLRSMYEPLTNSCLSAVNLDEQLYRRSCEYFKPGLLKRETVQGSVRYSLVSAEKAVVVNGIKDKEDIKEGKDSGVTRFEKKHEEEFKKYEDKIKEHEKDKEKSYKVGCRVEVQTNEDERKKAKEEKKKVDRLIVLEEESSTKEKETGYYFKGEPGPTKVRETQNAFVFLEVKPKETIRKDMTKNSPEMMGLQTVLESYEGYEEYKSCFKAFIGAGNGEEYFPVHYSEIKGVIEKGKQKPSIIYLSPACITKEAFYNTVGDILEAQGKHQPCTDVRQLCPGCSLFGMTGNDPDTSREIPDKYPNAWASKVRVQDAVTTVTGKDNLFMKRIDLLELASPKISCSEFYLMRPKFKDVLSWSYDYYTVKEGGKIQVHLRMPELLGRKCYWHHTKPNLWAGDVENTQRNETVSPLKNGIPFTFSVYFEHVTKTQLDQLIWLCNISSMEENGRAKYGYKLGKGKPLGLGSVEFRVTDVRIRNLHGKDGRLGFHMDTYEDTFRKKFQMLNYEEVGFLKGAKETFLRMCEFDAAKGVPVHYPFTSVQIRNGVILNQEQFKWFVSNHINVNKKGMCRKRTEMQFEDYLKPLTGDSEITLPVHKEEKNKGKNWNNKNPGNSKKLNSSNNTNHGKWNNKNSNHKSNNNKNSR